MWFPQLLYHHRAVTYYKCRFSAPTPDLLTQKLEVAQQPVLTRAAGDTNICSSFRAIAIYSKRILSSNKNVIVAEPVGAKVDLFKTYFVRPCLVLIA